MTDLDRRNYRIEDRYRAEHQTVALTGIQALARLPIDQLRADRRDGRNTAALVSGYPGSPLGGFDSAAASAARLVPDLPIHCRPAANEELGVSMVMGSQLASEQPDALYDGVVGIWYGKAPGVDRSVDALRHAVYAGTSRWGGAVALVGDDPNAKSSTLPSSSAGVVADLHMPLLYPGDAADVLDLGRHAIALSRFTGLWSALKIVADVADGMATVQLDPERGQSVTPALFDEAARRPPDGRLLTPHTIDLEQEIYDVRYPLAINYASANKLNHVTVDAADAWIGIVASGITYREIRAAFDRLGLTTDADIASCGIRLLRMQMPIPFDPDTVRNFAQGLETVFVVEEKQPSIESSVKDALYHQAQRPDVIGKTDRTGRPLIPRHGHLEADDLLAPLRSVLGERLKARLIPEKPTRIRIPLISDTARSPFFCSGCPHNRSTEAPEGSLVGAGIGCHTMALLMDEERVGDIAGLTCMGNEGSQWIGMASFVERSHLIQNLGDGTYFHSGQLAIHGAVAAEVNITYKLLYNGTVAMTGGQDPQGQIGVGALATSLLANGVAAVLVTTDEPEKYGRSIPGTRHRVGGDKLPSGVEVWDRSRLIEAQEHLASIPGTTVLIHDQACAAETRRARKRGLAPTPAERVVINPRICEGCGDCGQVSNCLSVQPTETDFGRKTTIDQSSCNLDFSCLEGDCPSFMTVIPAPTVDLVIPEPPELATPTPSSLDTFAMRITGIGGTGVVTIAQIIGTAAMLDGYHVNGLDQIGLSQKAGPVVSDIRLSKSSAGHTNRLGSDQADLLLVCDQLVAVTEPGRLVCSTERTAVVGSTTATPTGDMITHPERSALSTQELQELIASDTLTDAHHWADSGAITTALFGDAVLSNIFVVGMAIQSGHLPVSVESIERAIELNGVAVKKNQLAFGWGRAQIAHPTVVTALLPPATAVQASALSHALATRVRALTHDANLRADIERRANDLVGFQSLDTAKRYVETLERSAEVDNHGDLLRAVAINLHKLTAYKDEYEVARLMLADDGLEDARALANGGAMAYKLHPPMLRALGIDRKITISTKAGPALRALAAGKRLRGTALDPFGRAHVRGIERELLDSYRSVIDELIDTLKRGSTPELLAAAVTIAGLPDQVRGFESLKVERAAVYRKELAHSLGDFRAKASQ